MTKEFTGISLDPLDDGKSKIQLINFMGGDLDIVNDARASFDKTCAELEERDVKLIRFLVKHVHTSPFRGVVFKFKVKAPLYICRQWWKHVVASNHNDEQIGWNERSFRYTSIHDSSEFYIPTGFRMQSENNKQASEGSLSPYENTRAIAIYQEQCENSYKAYSRLLTLGVGREQARGVLAPSVYTSWVWTVSLQALLHFVDLRHGDGAQSEIAQYARAVEQLIEPVVPVVLKIWQEE